MNEKKVLLLTDDSTTELLTSPEGYDVKADIEIIPYSKQGITLGKYNYSQHEPDILIKAIAKQLEDSQKVLIIHCHSFDNKLINGDLSQKIQHPDILIGSDDFHTPRGLYKYALILLRLQGYNVELNNCDFGTILPMEYYGKNKHVYSITIEVNPNVYLIPGSIKKNENYDKVNSDMGKLLRFLINNLGVISDYSQT